MAASSRSNDGAAYVSAEPGAVADASTVEIENLRLHEVTPVQLVAGGFDPVTIPAAVGDSLEFRFTLTGGGVTVIRAAVPVRRRPRVVRTHPARGRRDVAINSIVTTVFSEPINPTTLRDSTVRLLRDGVAVRGTIRPAPGPVPGVEFVPAEPLLPATTYRLVFDGRITDLSGDALEVPDPIEFVTFGEGGTGVLTVITTTQGTDQPDGYAIMVDGRFAENIGVSDTVVITGLGAGEHHVLLSAMSEYCYATGGLYRQARLTPTLDARVVFNVVCTDLPELELRVATTGVERDEDGYRVVVNRLWDASVPPEGTLPLREVRYGINVVSLYDVRHNCRDPQGLRRVVDLTAGQTGTVSFTLRCTPDFTPPERIAFASYLPTGLSAIVIADADGANRLQLTDGTAEDRLPAWSPDGSRLAFVRGSEWDPSQVFLVNADGSGLRERVLTFNPGTIVSIAWISAGQELALSTATGVVYVIRTDGDIDASGDPAVRQFGAGYSSYGSAWSPVEPRIA
ncbi:MAG: Ig-like domain-containing protein [Gemmatimonadota bacterium]